MIPHKRGRSMSGVSNHIMKRKLSSYNEYTNPMHTRLSGNKHGNIFEETKFSYMRINYSVPLSEYKLKCREHSKLSIAKRIYYVNSKDCVCMNAG